MNLNTVDYLSDAPDYRAWAGTGQHAERIHAAWTSGDHEAMVEFMAAVNAEVDRRVHDGDTVSDALAEYDPEAIAERIATSHTVTCRTCGAEFVARYENGGWQDTDGAGDHMCDDCAGNGS